MKPSTTLAALVAHCRKLTRPLQTTDAELLRRFVGRRDHAAFEELLERYAPLVWGVCRRIVVGETDCEDAFQAVFLTLFRKAAVVDPRRPLGAWLHGVAVRAAHKAAARSRREPTLSVVPERATIGDIADELGNRELFRIVDDEIARLPALLREPFVLCCLEGRTRDEAAAALGCTVAAIKSRLERSRTLLRRRLERRGFGLPAAFLVLGLTGGHVRASLRAKALQCVLGSAPSAVAALVPATVTSLASKLTLTAISLVVVGTLGFGTFRVIETESSKEIPVQAKDIAPKSPQPPAAEKPQSRLDRFGDPLPPGAIRRFGSLRFRHGGIEDLAFTPDGKRLIAGIGSDTQAVFDARTGRRLREVGKSTPGSSITEFAVSPDGKWIASCGGDVLLWEIETGRLVRELHCGNSHAVAFSADGKVLAAAGWAGREDAEIRLVELATGRHLGKWVFKEVELVPADLHPLAFSPDGKYLAGLFSKRREVKSSVYDKVSSQVWLLDAKNGSRVRTFASPGGLIGAFAFQAGTGRLATIEKKGVLRFWDAETGKEIHHFSLAQGKWDNQDDSPPVLRFSGDGRRCAVADGNAGLLLVVDAQTGREVRRIEIDKATWWIAADLSRDGRAIASARSYSESCVRVWDVDSGVERLGDAGHRTPPILSLSADEGTLIGRSEDGQVIYWDRRSGQAVQRRQETAEQTGRPVFGPGTGDWTLRGPRWRLRYHFATSMLSVHSLDDDRLIAETEWLARVQDLALSPDGVYVATKLLSRPFNTVLLWNPEKEKKPRQLTGNVDRFRRLHFSHDGKRLIASADTRNASPSSALWVWDVATARPIHKLPTDSPFGAMLLTADDRVLIYGGWTNDGTVRVWDMETGKELASFTDPPSKERGGIGGLALSADERFLAVIFSREDASTVSVWETGNWKPIRIFAPVPGSHSGISMVFSRDGRSLLVSNSDTTILEWDVSGRFGHKTEVPNKDRLNVLWRTLPQTPDKAYAAVWEMLDHADESVPFLIEKLAPVKPVEEKRVQQLLAQLDSESFAEREEASRQLSALGEQIVPMLRQALKARPSLEMKKRIEGAIESLNRLPTPEQLRLLRALAVLEWSNRPEAVEHLRRLAGGAASASLTQAAQAAWQRRKH